MTASELSPMSAPAKAQHSQSLLGSQLRLLGPGDLTTAQGNMCLTRLTECYSLQYVSQDSSQYIAPCICNTELL